MGYFKSPIFWMYVFGLMIGLAIGLVIGCAIGWSARGGVW